MVVEIHRERDIHIYVSLCISAANKCSWPQFHEALDFNAVGPPNARRSEQGLWRWPWIGPYYCCC